MTKILDITDRNADYKLIYNETFRTELGLRAISFMYDEHSNDKNSYDNILRYKDNIQYRLFSATHQYLVFLKELTNAEKYLQSTFQKNPNYLNGFIGNHNPFYDKVEQELSSEFDNIVFQVSSIFDYLSHIICYMFFRNKDNTVYWSKLARMARGKNTDLSCVAVKQIIDNVDRRFVYQLYEYRSRLIHNYRDKHIFGGNTRLSDFRFNIKIMPSKIALKHFKLINDEITPEDDITLTFLASWIIKRTFIEIETILDVLSIELKKNSFFDENLFKPKKGENALILMCMNPETKQGMPFSEALWLDYKKKACR